MASSRAISLSTCGIVGLLAGIRHHGEAHLAKVERHHAWHLSWGSSRLLAWSSCLLTTSILHHHLLLEHVLSEHLDLLLLPHNVLLSEHLLLLRSHLTKIGHLSHLRRSAWLTRGSCHRWHHSHHHHRVRHSSLSSSSWNSTGLLLGDG